MRFDCHPPFCRLPFRGGPRSLWAVRTAWPRVILAVAFLTAFSLTKAKGEPAATRTNLQHWAFKAPQKPKLPEAKNPPVAGNDLDKFILARLEKEGLRLSAEADKTTLLRRVSLDLIGLPPTIDALLRVAS